MPVVPSDAPMPSSEPTLLVAVTELTVASAATSGGLVGSFEPVVEPGTLRSQLVLVSPMPRMKFFWQEYWIGSSQFVMTGKPSTSRILLGSDAMLLQAGT